MSFVSLTFLSFYSLTLLLYYTLFRSKQALLLLTASILFYCFSGPKYIIYVLITALSTYLCAYFISDIYVAQEGLVGVSAYDLKLRKEVDKKRARKILSCNFLIIIGLFIFLRYFNFLSQSIADIGRWFHVDRDPLLLNLIIPLGLSYYTFTNIGYILDVYWKKISAEKEFTRFALFTMYFPHIVQGPIARYQQLAPQFSGQKVFDYNQMTSGMQLMLWGYFKKMVIADRLNIFVSQIYDNYQIYHGMTFIVATIFYSLQIYADFSGCMDIVSGVSETFGISLAKNFNHPYFSRTIPEFWRRWHITLGTWFKDYVFYPASRSEFCKHFNKWVRTKWGTPASRTWASVLPLVCVWLLTGIWHGAAWKYVFWGGFHGLLIISGTVFSSRIQQWTDALKINVNQFSWHLFQIIRTFTLCCIGRVFFRAESLSAAFGIFRQTVADLQPWILFDGSLYTYGLDRPNFILAILCILILFIVDLLQEHFSIRQEFSKQNIIFRWIVLYTAIFSILIFGIYGPGYDASQFIYNKF